ncbi:MAG: urocanate hydratase [Oligoflexus sp.]
MSNFQAKLPDNPPPPTSFEPNIRRAPKRDMPLDLEEQKLALRNALRYVPQALHEELAAEFYQELMEHGRIYGYRYRPHGDITGRPINEYKGRSLAGKALQVMIDNNLAFDIALYPYELVTYGESGQVCQNWMQYRLIKQYLEQITENETLVMQSGHPLGLFPSRPEAPRVITTNGLMVGMFDRPEEFQKAAALGVANYGQMTAGGWMYIGPQGIVHGTYNTLVIAGRLKLGLTKDQNLAGKLFVSSGLGGMSGAQGKAVSIAGGVGIIAEVDASRIAIRQRQGWIHEVSQSPKEAFRLAQQAQKKGEALAVAFHGNIVDLLEYAVTAQINIDLLSDQTSCHAVYEGGYCPQEMDFNMRTRMLAENPQEFRRAVDRSLHRHFTCIKALSDRGAYFFDYGNSFMKAIFDAGVRDIARNGQDERAGFIWPSYVEDILGPELFDYGYGPFRWVCLSGEPCDLQKTDSAAAEVMQTLRSELRYQDLDNLKWVREAASYELVVGTQARILYQDAKGRHLIAKRFNQMVRQGEVGPIMLGRDHHDTGGTDSPYRETSNIKDGSKVMADMATQIFAGNAARGMTLIALHNGGGVGIGKSINGGFGLLLDGSEKTDRIIDTAVPWDVMGGVARRAWAGNQHAIEASHEYEAEYSGSITKPQLADSRIIDAAIAQFQAHS